MKRPPSTSVAPTVLQFADRVYGEWNGVRHYGTVSHLRQCPHGMHHPHPFDPNYPHGCDGCWCEGERDRCDYGWPHDTTPEAAIG